MKIEKVAKEDIFKFILDNADEICRKHSLKIREDTSIVNLFAFFNGKMSTSSKDDRLSSIIEYVICKMYGIHYKIIVIEKDDHCLFYKGYIEDGRVEPGEPFKGYVRINGDDIKIIGKVYSDFVICKFPIMGDNVYKIDLLSKDLFITSGEYTFDNSFDQYENSDGKEVILFNLFIAKEIVSYKNEITRGIYSWQTGAYNIYHKKDTKIDWCNL